MALCKTLCLEQATLLHSPGVHPLDVPCTPRGKPLSIFSLAWTALPKNDSPEPVGTLRSARPPDFSTAKWICSPRCGAHLHSLDSLPLAWPWTGPLKSGGRAPLSLLRRARQPSVKRSVGRSISLLSTGVLSELPVGFAPAGAGDCSPSSSWVEHPG